MMNRKEEADKILTHVCKYLTDAGWELEDTGSFQWKDPEESKFHRTDFAFCIQTSRDLGAPDAEYEIICGDEYVSSVIGPKEDAWREAMHYAKQYQSDWKIDIMEVTRHKVWTNR